MNITKLALIPQPQKIHIGQGWLSLPAGGVIGIAGHSLYAIARKMEQLLFKGYSINISRKGLKDTVSLGLAKDLKSEGYRLSINKQGIRIEGASAAGVFYGLQTLRQIAEQSPAGRLPVLAIDDWPDFQDRGICNCISHGRVPKLEQLKKMADCLSYYKINQLQLYTKHTFAFRGHPDIGKETSPLSAEDILELDAYCRERYVELVPALASFANLNPVLKHPQYHHLAEDWGIGKYVTPDKDKQKRLKNCQYATLSPANPEIYDFLDSLFAEFLPLFSSKRFNVGCDETFDLGYGQSYKLCQKLGTGRVYLNHIIKLNEICRKYGKKIMMWGDIIRHYPDLIAEIPKDVTVLDWGYESNHDFESIRDFKKTGLSFYACPSTCSWVLFPLLPRARANISGFAAAAHKHGGLGLLNTEWGTGGHYNLTEFSWHGFLFGAEQGWNTKADQKNFTTRFVRLFLKSVDPALADAIDRLGEISSMKVYCNSQSLWQCLYFASRGKPVFKAEWRINAKLGQDALPKLDRIRSIFRKHMLLKGEDPLQVLPYWIFAVDTIRHAARKLAVYGHGRKVTARARAALRNEFASLKTRFCKLWLDRNRPSEINIVLDAYRQARRAVASFEKPKAYTDFVSKMLISRPLPGVGNLQSLEYPANRKSLGFKLREFPAAFCDLHNDVFACGERDLMVFFVCFLEVSKPMSLSAGIGYDGPLKVWIDGEMKFHDPNGTNPGEVDKASVPFKVNPGKHEIMIALSANHGKAWGLFLRFLRHDVLPRRVQQGPEAYCLPRISCR